MANTDRRVPEDNTRDTATPRGPSWPSPGVAAAIFFGLAAVYFLPAFLPGSHVYGTDYFAGGYFFYHFIAERLAAGELPKWVPYIFGGLPIFANPGSTYQPVHLLASLLLPMPRVLAAVFMVHIGLGGFGMFLLARELRCRGWVALLAGVAYQFTGLTLSWVYAGHDGRIIVATLAPMFFFFLHRGIRTGRLPSFVGAAATLALALLSFQIQNSYYLLLGAATWAVFALVHLGVARQPVRLAKRVALGLGAVAFAFVLASVNFLPFLDYIDESPRGEEGGRGYEYSISYSMPPGELLSTAVPEQHGVSVVDPETGEALFPAYEGANGFKLHTEYLGAFVLVLFALGVYYSRGNRYWWFFGGLALFMLTIALGGSTPLYRVYYELLPGTNRFRAPSLSFFLVAMSLVVMAALTMQQIAELREHARQRRPRKDARESLARLPWIAGAVVAVALFGLMSAAGGPSAAGAPTAAEGWGRFAFFAALVAGVLWLWTRERLDSRMAALALLLITTADLWIIGKRFFHTTVPAAVTFAPDDVISFLEMQPEPFRVWTFPFPRQYRSGGAYGGDYPMLFGIEQVGGEHPNQLQRWNEYVGAGTATYIDWHNLIAEAGVVDTPQGQAIAFRGEPGFLEAANVRYIVSMAPLAHPALREVHRGSALIYENTAALPRAYLVPEVEEVPAGDALEAMQARDWDPTRVAFVPASEGIELPDTPDLEGRAEVVEHSPDRVVVRVETNRPALLVLADNYYEGWEVEIDGAEAEVIRTNHTFRGVFVDAGESEVVFEFEPPDLFRGFVIYLGGMVLLLFYGAFLLVRRWRARDHSGAANA